MKKMLIDIRVLTHKHYSGVENYTKNILSALQKLSALQITQAKPKTSNKYLAHLWVHLFVAFSKESLLFFPANIAPIFCPRSKKLVLTLHDLAFKEQAHTFSLFFRIYYTLLIPLNIKRADAIITVSEASKKTIISHYPKARSKISVIPLAADAIYYKRQKIQKEDTILYVGSLNQRKNFLRLIEAFELIKDQKTTLTLVGNFSESFALDTEAKAAIDKARANPKIHFLHNISDQQLALLYNKAKIFILPSLYEGFGLPLLEAMCSQTAIIASDIEVFHEVGGDAVLYCDPHDPNDIKEKITLLLNDVTLRHFMETKAKIRALDFSWNKTAKKHLEVFTKVLNETSQDGV